MKAQKVAVHQVSAQVPLIKGGFTIMEGLEAMYTTVGQQIGLKVQEVWPHDPGAPCDLVQNQGVAT